MSETGLLDQPFAAETRSAQLRMVTALGDVVLHIDTDRAPCSAAAFLHQVETGAYDGGAFFRLVRADNDNGTPRIEVVQGSCRAERFTIADIPHEPTDRTGLRHRHGTVSLPRGDSGTTASGFFICVGDQPALDAGGGRTDDQLGFAAFGRVVEGMDVVEAIHRGKTVEEASIDFLRGQIAAEPVAIYHIAPEPSAPADRLDRLADDYWRFRVREFPTEATAAGIPGHNHRLEGAANADYARRALCARALLNRAETIDAAALATEDATTLALLEGQLVALVEAHALDEHHRSRMFPFGFADVPDQLAQVTPLGTVADREGFAARLEAIPDFFGHNLAVFSEGLAAGYRLPRVLVPRLLTMLDSYLARDGFVARIERRLAAPIAAMPPERLAEQRARIMAIVTDRVLPALRTVRDTIAALDADALTDAIGLCDQPGGLAYYQFKVRQQTSLESDPAAIHEIGVKEVARIHAELDALLVEMGRPGERDAVAAELDARLAPDGEALLMRVRACAKRIDGLLPPLFGRMPGITYAVESMEVGASAALPPALAQPSPADRSMPGIFWLTALPQKCPLHLIVPLTLHEAWPGHLMQLALAHELANLPAFRRYGWTDYNGYIEGWALYCERLGYDLGLYDEPADRFGLLTFELWRAARLVVDTGIHGFGWSRDAAIAYMMTNTFLPQATIESEVDRYIGMPAQALSYKLGERTIVALREQAETRLGEHFSLRAFHDALLAMGPVSLTALGARMERWIEESLVS